MCDSLCVFGADQMVFGKNSDRPPSEVQVVERFPARAEGGTIATQYLDLPDAGSIGFVGSRPTWLWGVEHGINAAGIVIGNEKIWTTDNPHRRPAALLGMDIVRLGLEQSTTADEALAVMTGLIERYGQGGSGEEAKDEPYDSSFLIADATQGWIIETRNRSWAARPVERGAAISNRIGLTTNWTVASAEVAPGTDVQTWRHPSIPTTIADHRLAATTAWITGTGDTPDPAGLVAALRDHGSGPWGPPLVTPHRDAVPPPREVGDDHRGVTVCMHIPAVQATTASMVVAIDRHDALDPRMWFALGSPCVSIYIPVFARVGVPTLLSDPTIWRRFATLRDRVESEPTTITDIRRRLAAVEDELWTQAAGIADADAGAQAAFTESVDRHVDPVLADLGI